jgi:hypothetical protein
VAPPAPLKQSKTLRGVNMDQEAEKKIAILESMNDQLVAEFNHLNALLKELGFDDGIESLKIAAVELIRKRKNLE